MMHAAVVLLCAACCCVLLLCCYGAACCMLLRAAVVLLCAAWCCVGVVPTVADAVGGLAGQGASCKTRREDREGVASEHTVCVHCCG